MSYASLNRLKRYWRRFKNHNDNFYVFPAGNSKSKKGHITEPSAAWRRLLKHSELKDLRIHDLRRTNGSWQAKTGGSLQIIGKSLGHKDIATTAIYARLDIDPVKESVNRATEAMLQAINR